MERSDSLIKAVSVFVFLALVAYIVFSWYNRTELLDMTDVVALEIRDSTATEGVVVRDETLVRATGAGIAVTAADGMKVPVGGTIAVQYSGARARERAADMQDIRTRIEQITSLQGGATGDQLREQSIMELSACVTSGDLSDLYTAELDVRSYIIDGEIRDETGLETELEALNAQLDDLISASVSDTTTITAEQSGIFMQSTDGYENVTPDDLYDIRPGDLDELFGDPDSGKDVIGKIVVGIDWYYVTTLEELDTAKLSVGDTVTIQFTRTYSGAVDMKVYSISPAEDGVCVVVFVSGSSMLDVAGLRDMTGEVIFSSETGLRVPRESAHVDSDGGTYVYILEGLRAKKVPVTVTHESGDYYMVRQEDGGLRVGDQVIISAANLHDGAVVAE